MFYSKTAHASGASGFFFADDANAPKDVVDVTETDVQSATNLPTGSTYDFDATGKLTTTAPSAAFNLAQTKTIQIATLTASYNTAIQLPVAHMATTFQTDSSSQDKLTKRLVAGAIPAGFAWLDANNILVSMTFAQLQGLAGEMLIQGQAAFVKLQTLKAQVRTATTIAGVQAVVW